jgi:hypothetical protein
MSAIGLSFGYTVGLMILGHVAHQSFPYFNASFLPFLIGGANAALPIFFDK